MAVAAADPNIAVTSKKQDDRKDKTRCSECSFVSALALWCLRVTGQRFISWPVETRDFHDGPGFFTRVDAG
jgi:hypothetical protein